MHRYISPAQRRVRNVKPGQADRRLRQLKNAVPDIIAMELDEAFYRFPLRRSRHDWSLLLSHRVIFTAYLKAHKRTYRRSKKRPILRQPSSIRIIGFS